VNTSVPVLALDAVVTDVAVPVNTGGASAIVNCALMELVTVAVVVPMDPAVERMPVNTPSPPPLPSAVPKSNRSCRSVRLAFDCPLHAAAADALSLAAARTTKQ
jgi:hypothetical protein